MKVKHAIVAAKSHTRALTHIHTHPHKVIYKNYLNPMSC